jgi:hypothetical protein
MAQDQDKTAYVPGATQENAVLLLAAVEELELDPHVVQVEGDGFRAPKEVCDKAGVQTAKEDEEPQAEEGTVADQPAEGPPGADGADEDTGDDGLPPRGRAKKE